MLVRVSAGLELPDAGTVAISGQSTTAMTSDERGRLRLREVGLVDAGASPQRDTIVVDAIALPVRASRSQSSARACALDALEYVALGECASIRWSELSTSERALALVARAIVRDPCLLIVDDVTADLDHLQMEEVGMLLRRLSREKSVGVLMTTSSMSALAHTDESLVIRSGAVSPLGGTAGELLRFPGCSAQ